MAWPVDMSLTSGGTSSLPKEKSLPEFDASEALAATDDEMANGWESREAASRKGMRLAAPGELRTCLRAVILQPGAAN